MAATLTADQEALTFFSFPITKQENTETLNPLDGTPDLLIWGKATDGTIDGDQEIVDPEWSAKALQEWFDTRANIRMSHDPKRPVGKGVDIALTSDGHWVKSLICDPLAKHFIRNNILNDYSVGISNPDFRYRDQKLDPLGKARRIITGRPDGSSRISEVTVCDRGSNFNSQFQLAKAAADGSCEFVGKMLGDPEEIAKAAPTSLAKTAHVAPEADTDDTPVTVDVPKSASITFSPASLKKLLDHRAEAEARQEDAVKAIAAAEVGVYKRTIDTATRRRLHSQGRALANLSYPIETHEDADNAVTLALSGHGDVGAAKALIRRVARKEGWQDILDRLDGKGKDAGSEKAAKPRKGKKNRQAPSGAEGTAMTTATIEAPETVKGDAVAEAPQEEPQVTKADDGGSGDGPDTTALHHDDGEDDDTDSDADAMDKAAVEAICVKYSWTPEQVAEIPAEALALLVAAEKAAMPDVGKKPPKAKCGSCGQKCKPSCKFCPGCGKAMGGAVKADDPDGSAEKSGKPVPGEGVTGSAEHDIQAAPEHREPDGPAIEALEHDAHLPTVPDSSVMQSKVAALHRSLGVPHDAGWLHDLTCPAFAPDTAKAAHPLADLSMIDDAAWQAKALDMAATAPLEDARAASMMWQNALTVKQMPGELYDELMGEAHKAFRDANPGPGSAPTPGEIPASRFNRPYISAGHGALSPGHDGPHKAPIHPGHISATDFQRGPLTAGHAEDSPANASPRPTPVPAPEVPGVPSRVYYTRLQRDNARQAMTAMHDHIARTFPDVCPMHGPNHTSPGAGQRPVPAGVGGPVPHGASKTAATTEDMTAAQAVTEPAGTAATGREVLVAKAARLERKLRKARREAGLEVEVTGEVVRQLEPAILQKSALGSLTASVDPGELRSALAEAFPSLAAINEQALEAAVTKATAPLLEKMAEQDKKLKKQAKVLDAIADQPDPAVTAYRGVALAGIPKSSSPPAGAATVAQRAEHAQASVFNAMVDTWRSDPDPGRREEAFQVLKQMTGLAPGNNLMT